MSHTGFVQHKGRQILFMNFAGIEGTGEALMAIEEARKFVASQPRRRELLVLVDVSATNQSSKAVEAMKALAAHDAPWVLASATVGITGMRRMVYKAIILFSGRKIATFKTLEEAKDWLVLQWVPPMQVPDNAPT